MPHSKPINSVQPAPFSTNHRKFRCQQLLRLCQVSLHPGMSLVMSLEAGISCHCKFSGGPRRVDRRYEA